MNPIHSLIGRLNNAPVFLSPTYNGMAGVLRHALSVTDMQAASEEHMKALSAIYCADEPDPEDEFPPYLMIGNIALIPIQGFLMNRFTWSCSWATGYDYILGAVEHAMANPRVTGIAYDIDSFGGECQGCFEATDAIIAMKADKPIYAFVNANACSAAYAVASTADKIIAVPSGCTGSIGVVLMHIDYSKMLEEDGIKVTFVYAGDHKKDGNPYEALSSEVKADLQKRVDSFYDMFVSRVAANRGMTEEAVIATQARAYASSESLSVGLIDAVEAVPTAIAAFVTELNGSNPTEITMEQTAEQIAAAAALKAANDAATKAAADASAAERTRISAIVGSEEAKERGTLAQHLAFKTNMSAEEAKGVLASAAKDTPVAAKATEANPFQAAMSATGNPDVGAGGAGGEGDPDKTKANVAEIVKAYSAASGFKPKVV